MPLNYGPRWVINSDTFRGSAPSPLVPRILLQIESSGYDDSVQYGNQRIVLNGVESINQGPTRSYTASRLVWSSGWTRHSTNQYDVYGAAANATSLLSYLQTFNTSDILILTTYDEPFENKSVFQNELINNFGAKLQSSSIWGGRCSYQLVAVKGKGVIYENIKPQFSYQGIHTTLYMV